MHNHSYAASPVGSELNTNLISSLLTSSNHTPSTSGNRPSIQPHRPSIFNSALHYPPNQTSEADKTKMNNSNVDQKSSQLSSKHQRSIPYPLFDLPSLLPLPPLWSTLRWFIGHAASIRRITNNPSPLFPYAVHHACLFLHLCPPLGSIRLHPLPRQLVSDIDAKSSDSGVPAIDLPPELEPFVAVSPWSDSSRSNDNSNNDYDNNDPAVISTHTNNLNNITLPNYLNTIPRQSQLLLLQSLSMTPERSTLQETLGLLNPSPEPAVTKTILSARDGLSPCAHTSHTSFPSGEKTVIKPPPEKYSDIEHFTDAYTKPGVSDPLKSPPPLLLPSSQAALAPLSLSTHDRGPNQRDDTSRVRSTVSPRLSPPLAPYTTPLPNGILPYSPRFKSQDSFDQPPLHQDPPNPTQQLIQHLFQAPPPRPLNRNLSLYIEISECRNLPNAGSGQHCNPYVTITFDDNTLQHRLLCVDLDSLDHALYNPTHPRPNWVNSTSILTSSLGLSNFVSKSPDIMTSHMASKLNQYLSSGSQIPITTGVHIETKRNILEKRTTTKYNTNMPVYSDEKFHYSLTGFTPHSHLIFNVYSRHQRTNFISKISSDLLGSVCIPLTDLLDFGTVSGWYRLTNGQYIPHVHDNVTSNKQNSPIQYAQGSIYLRIALCIEPDTPHMRSSYLSNAIGLMWDQSLFRNQPFIPPLPQPIPNIEGLSDYDGDDDDDEEDNNSNHNHHHHQHHASPQCQSYPSPSYVRDSILTPSKCQRTIILNKVSTWIASLLQSHLHPVWFGRGSIPPSFLQGITSVDRNALNDPLPCGPIVLYYLKDSEKGYMRLCMYYLGCTILLKKALQRLERQTNTVLVSSPKKKYKPSTSEPLNIDSSGSDPMIDAKKAHSSYSSSSIQFSGTLRISQFTSYYRTHGWKLAVQQYLHRLYTSPDEFDDKSHRNVVMAIPVTNSALSKPVHPTDINDDLILSDNTPARAIIPVIPTPDSSSIPLLLSVFTLPSVSPRFISPLKAGPEYEYITSPPPSFPPYKPHPPSALTCTRLFINTLLRADPQGTALSEAVLFELPSTEIDLSGTLSSGRSTFNTIMLSITRMAEHLVYLALTRLSSDLKSPHHEPAAVHSSLFLGSLVKPLPVISLNASPLESLDCENHSSHTDQLFSLPLARWASTSKDDIYILPPSIPEIKPFLTASTGYLPPSLVIASPSTWSIPLSNIDPPSYRPQLSYVVSPLPQESEKQLTVCEQMCINYYSAYLTHSISSIRLGVINLVKSKFRLDLTNINELPSNKPEISIHNANLPPQIPQTPSGNSSGNNSLNSTMGFHGIGIGDNIQAGSYVSPFIDTLIPFGPLSLDIDISELAVFDITPQCIAIYMINQLITISNKSLDDQITHNYKHNTSHQGDYQSLCSPSPPPPHPSPSDVHKQEGQSSSHVLHQSPIFPITYHDTDLPPLGRSLSSQSIQMAKSSSVIDHINSSGSVLFHDPTLLPYAPEFDINDKSITEEESIIFFNSRRIAPNIGLLVPDHPSSSSLDVYTLPPIVHKHSSTFHLGDIGDGYDNSTPSKPHIQGLLSLDPCLLLQWMAIAFNINLDQQNLRTLAIIETDIQHTVSKIMTNSVSSESNIPDPLPNTLEWYDHYTLSPANVLVLKTIQLFFDNFVPKIGNKYDHGRPSLSMPSTLPTTAGSTPSPLSPKLTLYDDHPEAVEHIHHINKPIPHISSRITEIVNWKTASPAQPTHASNPYTTIPLCNDRPYVSDFDSIFDSSDSEASDQSPHPSPITQLGETSNDDFIPNTHSILPVLAMSRQQPLPLLSERDILTQFSTALQTISTTSSIIDLLTNNIQSTLPQYEVPSLSDIIKLEDTLISMYISQFNIADVHLGPHILSKELPSLVQTSNSPSKSTYVAEIGSFTTPPADTTLINQSYDIPLRPAVSFLRPTSWASFRPRLIHYHTRFDNAHTASFRMNHMIATSKSFFTDKNPIHLHNSPSLSLTHKNKGADPSTIPARDQQPTVDLSQLFTLQTPAIPQILPFHQPDPTADSIFLPPFHLIQPRSLSYQYGPFSWSSLPFHFNKTGTPSIRNVAHLPDDIIHSITPLSRPHIQDIGDDDLEDDSSMEDDATDQESLTPEAGNLGYQLKIMCASWNVGNNRPGTTEELATWLQPGADIYVIGTQENRFSVNTKNQPVLKPLPPLTPQVQTRPPNLYSRRANGHRAHQKSPKNTSTFSQSPTFGSTSIGTTTKASFQDGRTRQSALNRSSPPSSSTRRRIGDQQLSQHKLAISRNANKLPLLSPSQFTPYSHITSDDLLYPRNKNYDAVHNYTRPNLGLFNQLDSMFEASYIKPRNGSGPQLDLSSYIETKRGLNCDSPVQLEASLEDASSHKQGFMSSTHDNRTISIRKMQANSPTMYSTTRGLDSVDLLDIDSLNYPVDPPLPHDRLQTGCEISPQNFSRFLTSSTSGSRDHDIQRVSSTLSVSQASSYLASSSSMSSFRHLYDPMTLLSLVQHPLNEVSSASLPKPVNSPHSSSDDDDTNIRKSPPCLADTIDGNLVPLSTNTHPDVLIANQPEMHGAIKSRFKRFSAFFRKDSKASESPRSEHPTSIYLESSPITAKLEPSIIPLSPTDTCALRPPTIPPRPSEVRLRADPSLRPHIGSEELVGAPSKPPIPPRVRRPSNSNSITLHDVDLTRRQRKLSQSSAHSVHSSARSASSAHRHHYSRLVAISRQNSNLTSSSTQTSTRLRLYQRMNRPRRHMSSKIAHMNHRSLYDTRGLNIPQRISTSISDHLEGAINLPFRAFKMREAAYHSERIAIQDESKRRLELERQRTLSRLSAQSPVSRVSSIFSQPNIPKMTSPELPGCPIPPYYSRYGNNHNLIPMSSSSTQTKTFTQLALSDSPYTPRQIIPNEKPYTSLLFGGWNIFAPLNGDFAKEGSRSKLASYQNSPHSSSRPDPAPLQLNVLHAQQQLNISQSQSHTAGSITFDHLTGFLWTPPSTFFPSYPSLNPVPPSSIKNVGDCSDPALASVTSDITQVPPPHYTCLRSLDLFQTGIVIFVRTDLVHLVDIITPSVDKVTCGVGNVIRNKGGVSIGLDISGTQYLFINSHLAAHAKKFKERDRDYNRIASELKYKQTFTHNMSVLQHFHHVVWVGDLNYRLVAPMDIHIKKEKEKEKLALPVEKSAMQTPAGYSPPPVSTISKFSPTLLPLPPMLKTQNKTPPSSNTNTAQLHSNSLSGSGTFSSIGTAVQRPLSGLSSHITPNTYSVEDADVPYHQLEWTPVPTPDDIIVESKVGFEWILSLIKQAKWEQLYKYDQLYLRIKNKLSFPGFTDIRPRFPPTFKVAHQSSYITYNHRRTPSWCDRILYKSLPGSEGYLTPITFMTSPYVTSSDHKPVAALFSAALLFERMCSARDDLFSSLHLQIKSIEVCTTLPVPAPTSLSLSFLSSILSASSLNQEWKTSKSDVKSIQACSCLEGYVPPPILINNSDNIPHPQDSLNLPDKFTNRHFCIPPNNIQQSSGQYSIAHHRPSTKLSHIDRNPSPSSPSLSIRSQPPLVNLQTLSLALPSQASFVDDPNHSSTISPRSGDTIEPLVFITTTIGFEDLDSMPTRSSPRGADAFQYYRSNKDSNTGRDNFQHSLPYNPYHSDYRPSHIPSSTLTRLGHIHIDDSSPVQDQRPRSAFPVPQGHPQPSLSTSSVSGSVPLVTPITASWTASQIPVLPLSITQIRRLQHENIYISLETNNQKYPCTGVLSWNMFPSLLEDIVKLFVSSQSPESLSRPEISSPDIYTSIDLISPTGHKIGIATLRFSLVATMGEQISYSRL